MKLLILIKKEGEKMKCEFCGISDNKTRVIKSKFGMLCRKRYLQMYKYGKIKRTIYDRNEVIIHNDYAEIILRNKQQNIVGSAEIDIEDIDKIKDFKWHIKKSRNTNYAVYNNKGHSIFMHRVILDYQGDADVDHRDNNGLNNRKNNLRILSHSLNLINQHDKSNGVRKTSSGKYQSHIMIDGKSIYLGTFDTFIEAKQKKNGI